MMLSIQRLSGKSALLMKETCIFDQFNWKKRVYSISSLVTTMRETFIFDQFISHSNERNVYIRSFQKLLQWKKRVYSISSSVTTMKEACIFDQLLQREFNVSFKKLQSSRVFRHIYLKHWKFSYSQPNTVNKYLNSNHVTITTRMWQKMILII